MHRHRPSRDRRVSARRSTRLQGIQFLEQRCLLAGDLQGDEFRVNDYIAGSQQVGVGSLSAAASLDDGFIVAFAGRGTGDLDGVFTQRFDVDGNAVGTVLRVNSTTLGTQDDPSVAGNADGRYVVVWQGRGGADREGVFGQRFSADGQKSGGEFLVNTTVGGVQGKPAVAMDAGGRFAVVWTGNGPGDSKGVFLQLFDADGTKFGPEARVNVSTAGDQTDPSVAMADDGTIIVTWTSAHAGAGTDVLARRFSALGTADSGEVRVNSTTIGDQERSQVAMNGGGQFFVVWQSSLPNLVGAEIVGQSFNADASPQGAEKLVTPPDGTFHGYPQVTMADNGVAVVTWSALGAGTNRFDVFAQFYDTQGNADGATFRVNRTANGGQRFSSVALSDTGQSIVAWTGNGAGDTVGVFAQRVVAGGFVNEPPVIQGITDQLVIAGRQLRVQPTATDPDGPVSRLTWQFDPASTVPDGLQIDPTTGVITWTPGQSQIGIFTVTVLVTDSGRPNLADSEQFVITVAPDMTVPSFTLPQIEISVQEDASTQTITQFATNILGIGGNTSPNLQFVITSPDGSLNNVLGGPPILGADGTLTFTPKPGATGTANFNVVLNDRGAGGATVSSVAQAFRIVVQAVNSAPSNIVLFAPSVPVEADKTATFGGGSPLRIQVQDVDAGTSEIEVSLTLPTTGGGVFNIPSASLAAALLIDQPQTPTPGVTPPHFVMLTGDGVNDTAIRMQGSLNQINFVLSNLQYSPPAGFVGSIPVVMVTNDRGNTGTGGAKSDTTNFSFNVQRVNQAPVNSLPTIQQIMTEGGTLRFRQITGNAISISDADAGSGNVQVDVTVAGGVGTLSLAAPGALPSGVVLNIGTGTGDATFRLTGTIAGINAALDDLTFTPVENFFGTAQISILTNDLGNTGSGGQKTDVDTLAVTVNGVNDGPVITIPGSQTVDERGSLVFNNANGNVISVADPDAQGGLLEVSLSTPQGLMSLSNPSLVSFNFGQPQVGTGTLDAQMVFRGTLQSINAALNGLTYRPVNTLQNNAATTIGISVSDLGNTGSGGAIADTKTVAITVMAVNDAPVNVLPTQAQQTNEDTPLHILGLSVNDADAGTNPLTVTLRVNNGTLDVRTDVTGGLTAADVTTNGTNTVILFASRDAINATLANSTGLRYTPTADFAGTETLTIATNDNGNSGSGGPKQDSDNLTITVTAINDAPVITAPTTAADQRLTTDNPEPFAFTGSNVISVADPDVGGATMQVTLTATNGTLTMSGVSNLNFTAGDGTDDATMTFTATRAAINTALATLSFKAASLSYSGPAQVVINVNDLNNTGAGGPKTATATVFLTVAPSNNAPVNTVPSATINAVVGTPVNINGLSIADSDSGDANIQVTFTAAAGTLNLATNVTNGVQPGQIAGNGTGNLVIVAPRAVINTTLATGGSLQFTATAAGATSVVMLTDDLGNTGAGGAKTDSDTINFNVQAGNMAPVNSVPGGQTVAEDGVLTFNAANSNLISIADADVGSALMQVTLTVTQGTLTLSGVAGLSFSGFAGAAGDGTNDATMTFRGTLAAINTALSGMTYRPTGNFNGADTLTIVTNDQGNTGAGGAQTDTDTVAITVTAVNDAPVITRPAGQTTQEDLNLVFSVGNSNAISVADIDAAGQQLEVTLAAARGALTLATTADLTFSTGDGTGDANMAFRGTQTAINAALAGLQFTPEADFVGTTASVTVTVSDLGSTGSGGAQSDTETISINVTAVNDAPVNTVPGAQTVAANATLVFDAGRTISIADVDAAAANMQVTLAVTAGTLSMTTLTGLTFTTGDGTTDATMTFTGTLAALNAALATLRFNAPATGGDVTLTITTSDLGNTGAGGTKTDVDTVTITVMNNNNPPVVTAPATQNTAEDTALVFNTANSNLISIADPDIDTSDMLITMSATNGTLTLSGIAGLTFTVGDGTADATMTFTGTLASVNAALSGLTYLPTLDFAGTGVISITANDQGNTGLGGAMSDTEMVTVTITAINDPPTINRPESATTNQDTPLVFSAANNNPVTVTDPDLPAAEEMRVVLQPSNGTIAPGSTSNVTITPGANGMLTIQGTQTAVNAALAGMTFTPTTGFSGDATLGVMVFDDLTGAQQMDAETITITVRPPNAAPMITAPASAPTDEDTTLVFNTANSNLISIADPDAGAIQLEVTVDVTNGTLSLSGISGLTFTTGDGTSDATMTFRGLLADVNTALNGLSYVPVTDFNGAATLSISVNDRNTGSFDGAKTDSETVNITVNAVNDAPQIAAPPSADGTEDTALTFSAAGAGLISVADVDAAAAPLQITLNAPNGALTLSGIAGLTFTTGDGTADANMVFTGSLADINAALAGMVLAPTADFAGATTVSLMVNDQGNTGGAAQTANATINVTVSAVNDAPVNTVPQNVISTSANTPVAINGVSVADVDVLPADLFQVGLTSSNGTMTLVSSTGLTFIVGDATGETAMTFQGTLANVNAALNGMLFTPNTNFAGSASITVTSNDLGRNGSGGDKTDTDVISINIGGVNQPPVNSVPGNQETPEDTALVFSTANGNLISISDPDAGSAPVQVTLSVNNGALTLANLTGLTFSAGDGTSDVTMTFTGTLTSVNNALAGLSYLPTLNFNGTDTLTINANDQGNIGTGGALSDTDMVSIMVTAVDDPPTITGPDTAEILEDGMRVFSTANGNGLVIVDPDPAATIIATLTDENGVAALGSTTGITFGPLNAFFSGSFTDMNNAINGLTFTPDANYNGPASFTYSINPGVIKTVNITVLPVNDVPVFTKGANQSANASDGLTTVAGWASDISAGPSNESAQVLTFQVTNVDKPALFAAGGQPTIAANGTLTFTPNPAAIGTDTATISVRLHDDGDTANGGLDTSAVQTFTITVIGAADGAPVLTPIGPLAFNELSEFSLQLTATSNGAVTYSMTLGAGFDASNLPQITPTGLFTWLPLEDANATQSVFNVTFRVVDSMNRSDEETVQITVNEVNQAPTFATPRAVATIVGIPLTLTNTAEDRDLPAQGLTWSLAGGPAGNTATINPATGTINWTPSAADVGMQTFQVTVTDNGTPQLSTTRSLAIDVAASGSAPRINWFFVEDTGQSGSDGVTSRPDIRGTVIFEGANLMAFTADFADASPGADPVDLILEGILTGTGNVRQFLIDEGDYALLRLLQTGNGLFNNGTYELTLAAKGANNLTSTQVINLVFDNVPPVAPSSIALDLTFRNSNGTANATTVTIIGVAEPNSLIVLSNDGRTLTAVASNTGAFSIPDVHLDPNGVPEELSIRSLDLAGNESMASATFRFEAPSMSAALRSFGAGGATDSALDELLSDDSDLSDFLL